MGSQGLTSGRLAAFQSDVFASGLDLGRCEIIRNLGVYKAADAATIRQGMLVKLDASGELVACNSAGEKALGVAKWNKVTLGLLKIADEAWIAPANGATTALSRANVSNVTLRAAVGHAGTRLGEFTVDAATGVITNDDADASTFVEGTTYYATYNSEMTETDYRFQGKNFFNNMDDATIAEGRMSVIQGPGTIFTTEYASGNSTAMTIGAPVYTTTGGQFTAVAGGANSIVGHVIQLPTAADPFLGVTLA
jgi:hypothetical protein